MIKTAYNSLWSFLQRKLGKAFDYGGRFVKSEGSSRKRVNSFPLMKRIFG
jgi:hypothetical protein